MEVILMGSKSVMEDGIQYGLAGISLSLKTKPTARGYHWVQLCIWRLREQLWSGMSIINFDWYAKPHAFYKRRDQATSTQTSVTSRWKNML